MKKYFISFCIVASLLMSSSFALACDVKIIVTNNTRNAFYGNAAIEISEPWMRVQQNDLNPGAAVTYKFDGSALSCHGEYYLYNGIDEGPSQTIFINGTITINKDADAYAYIHDLDDSDPLLGKKGWFVSLKVNGVKLGPQER